MKKNEYESLGFMYEPHEMDALPVSFDKRLWVDHVLVREDERLAFIFTNGNAITEPL